MGGEGQIESQRGGERHLFCPENKKHGRKVNFAATWQGVTIPNPLRLFAILLETHPTGLLADGTFAP